MTEVNINSLNGFAWSAVPSQSKKSYGEAIQTMKDTWTLADRLGQMELCLPMWVVQLTLDYIEELKNELAEKHD